MFTPGFDPMTYYQMRSKDALREARQYRLYKEALKGRKPRPHLMSRILVVLGNRLKVFGASLEMRYSRSSQAEVQLDYNPSASEGC